MISPHQTRTALDTLYNYILAQPCLVECRGGLRADLKQLCRSAQSQDEELPLALLPVWGYTVAGGHDTQQAMGVAAAWRLLHLAGKLLNVAADGRPSTLLPGTPSSGLLNAGVSLIFLSQAVLAETVKTCATPAASALQVEFSRICLQAACAQHTQLKRDPRQSWADYQAIVTARSGAPFALALWAGAYLKSCKDRTRGEKASVSSGQVQALAGYGRHLGMMLQLADDFKGTWCASGKSDLAAGKRTWPLLYGEAMADAVQRARLAELVQRAPGNPAAEAEAKALLVHLDVPMALVLAAEQQRCLAEAALEPLPDSEARRALVALARRAALVPKKELVRE